MNLFINGEKTSFTLQDEKNARQIADAIADWLRTRGRIIDYIIIDGREYSQPSSSELEKIFLQNIQNMDFYSLPFRQFALRCLTDVKNYMDKFILSCRSGNIKREFDNAAEGIRWAGKMISEALSALSIRPETIPAGKIPLAEQMKICEIAVHAARQAGAAAEPADMEIKKISDSAAEIVLSLGKLLRNARLKAIEETFSLAETSGLEEALRQAVLPLEDAAEMLKEAAANLQKGHDLEAMQTLRDLAGALGGILHGAHSARKAYGLDFSMPDGGDNIDETLQALTNILRELLSAMENSDYVLLGDLIEYELAVIIPRLKTIIVSIADFILHTGQ
ncbi:MAG: hypothetical protein A2096_12025 [Spirochaetes bacterium GWF1_41_5]|nr:MAG: hypothetical protein A2096_12025 [Spirochaetes bacterium GWF1_41_5]HBE01835.1 hypothetical protein [Spirochaetia bacterium]